MNNRWRKIVNLDNSGYPCRIAKTENAVMVFSLYFWGTVAHDNHTEHQTPSFRKGNKR